MKELNLHGTGVALVTPINEKGAVDLTGLRKLVDHVIAGGVDYLVPLGTTGESATLSWDEKIKVLEAIIEHIKGKIPLVLGLGGNNTLEIAAKMEQVATYDIDAILSVSPYYNRPSQEGIYHHYNLLADKSPKPLVLYNVPGRTAANVEADTIIKLAQHENIVGVKDAVARFSQLAQIAAEKPEGFALISGEDSLALPTLAVGGDGVISVLANLLPSQFSSMISLGLKGDFEEARKIHHRFLDFYKLCSLEGNPTSIKAGLKAAGLIDQYVRLPLFEGSAELINLFKKELA